MGRPVAQLQQEITSAEFQEWIAYSRIEPFGHERTEYGFAMVASVIANSNRKKGAQPFKPADFMPDWGRQKRQTAEQMQSFLRAWSTHHNAGLT